MAATAKATPSVPRAQGSSSAKLRVYEHLWALNQHLQQARLTLQRLEKCPGLRPALIRSYQVKLEEVRSEANYELTEILSELELRDWAKFGRKRRAWEKWLEDPDDVYLQVEEREEERRKKGLPPRIGIILHPTPGEPEPQTPPEASGRRRARR